MEREKGEVGGEREGRREVDEVEGKRGEGWRGRV